MNLRFLTRNSLLLVFAIFSIIGGSVHGATMSQPHSSAQRVHTTVENNICQLVCPVQNRNEKVLLVKEEDELPVTEAIAAFNILPYMNSLYVVFLSVLILAFLNRKPPDILTANSLLRI